MKECIILAGGLGTRLAHLILNLPKCLAPVNDKPFLHYLITYLIHQRIDRFIFSLGYKSDQIVQFIQTQYPQLKAKFIVENEPLGTGGAVINAIQEIESDNFFLVNADTYYTIDFEQLLNFHSQRNAAVSIAVKPFIRPLRYGTVIIDLNGRIQNFSEKSLIEYGLINGGVYILNKAYFRSKEMNKVFSLEKDLFERFVVEDDIFAQVQDQYFIDIGVPEDYQRVQEEFKSLNSYSSKRTLFLDRDGVINNLRENDYVKSVEELEFTEGFLENIGRISQQFDNIFIVTNQQCIGKGIVSVETLANIHYKIIRSIRKQGGFITKVYYCPHLIEDLCNCRKPQPGLLDRIRQEYPEIRFSNSVFIGDSKTDMIAANSRNIKAILFNPKQKKFNQAGITCELKHWNEFHG
ncbi:MAG: HAD-IIIA family hydrolase [Saprospiraceae bacterium]|nr:HAD-IIIA family hydrolase [Saprospiraceae bacterium]